MWCETYWLCFRGRHGNVTLTYCTSEVWSRDRTWSRRTKCRWSRARRGAGRSSPRPAKAPVGWPRSMTECARRFAWSVALVLFVRCFFLGGGGVRKGWEEFYKRKREVKSVGRSVTLIWKARNTFMFITILLSRLQVCPFEFSHCSIHWFINYSLIHSCSFKKIVLIHEFTPLDACIGHNLVLLWL